MLKEEDLLEDEPSPGCTTQTRKALLLLLHLLVDQGRSAVNYLVRGPKKRLRGIKMEHFELSCELATIKKRMTNLGSIMEAHKTESLAIPESRRKEMADLIGQYAAINRRKILVAEALSASSRNMEIKKRYRRGKNRIQGDIEQIVAETRHVNDEYLDSKDDANDALESLKLLTEELKDDGENDIAQLMEYLQGDEEVEIINRYLNPSEAPTTPVASTPRKVQTPTAPHKPRVSPHPHRIASRRIALEDSDEEEEEDEVPDNTRLIRERAVLA